MNLARPIFICGDCKEVLSSKDLAENNCTLCHAKICPCMCHVANYFKCEDCIEHHEGQ